MKKCLNSEHINLRGTVSIRVDCGNLQNTEGRRRLMISDFTIRPF